MNRRTYRDGDVTVSRIHDHWQPFCERCGWWGHLYPGRTNEGYWLAKDRAEEHARVHHKGGE